MALLDPVFDKDSMLEDIRRIVACGIRRPGYPGDQATQEYLLDRFECIFLEHIHREPVQVNFWQPTETHLSIESGSGPDFVNVPCFAVPYTQWTSETGLLAESVFVGSGSPEDFKNKTIQGKIVVAEMEFGELNAGLLKTNSYFVVDSEHTIPEGPLHAANWLIKNFPVYYEAIKSGAAGFIGILKDNPIDGCEFYVPYDGALKSLPAVWVARESREMVAAAARNTKAFQFVSNGVGKQTDSHNLIGKLPGKGKESIVITCHHDAPFASAVEDASGLSVVLALAEAFRNRPEPLERNLVFLATAGHFHGGIGTQTFVSDHKDDLLRSTVACLGIEHIAEETESDGIGGYRKTGLPEVRALFMDQCPALIKIVEAAVRENALDRSIAVNAFLFGPEPPCDNAAFFTAGIPSVCHISGPLYLFDPMDRIDMVRAVDLSKTANVFYDCIMQLDSMDGELIREGITRHPDDPPSERPAWFQSPDTYLK
ncbi:MAG TPA: M28 family peptidase [Verrucomicrobiales bacterium]|nr:M28 family peptidase [Verrucomicrobiales bacterium]HIL71474.1 M28 family peptidase [Verrucomicrobiota bacterium]